MKACVLSEVGDYTKLQVKDVPDITKIGDDEILIQHSAIGVNFDDVMYRRGDYVLPEEYGKNPILGFEGVGNIEMLGKNVKGFKVGDQVGYAFCTLGAYAQKNAVDYRYCFSIPNEITPEIAAASLRKGLTAYYLIYKTCYPHKGDFVLIHSVAGGVGHLLAKLAKYAGLKVIGTVCDESKVSMALATGADFVINRAEEDFLKKTIEITEGKGVKVVYDGVGKALFDKSLDCLQTFGIYVSYGYASGKLDPIDVFRLRERNLFFTTPTLEIYNSNRNELILSSASLLDLVKKGVMIPSILRYGIDGIPQAHADLESGKTMGSLVVNVY